MSYPCAKDIEKGHKMAGEVLTILKTHLKNKNISYKSLAEKIGVTEHYVKSELNGYHINIRSFVMYASMVGLKVNISLSE